MSELFKLYSKIYFCLEIITINLSSLFKLYFVNNLSVFCFDKLFIRSYLVFPKYKF